MESKWRHLECDNCGRVYVTCESDEYANDFPADVYILKYKGINKDFCCRKCLAEHLSEIDPEDLRQGAELRSLVIDVCFRKSEWKEQ